MANVHSSNEKWEQAIQLDLLVQKNEAYHKHTSMGGRQSDSNIPKNLNFIHDGPIF